MMVSPFTHSWAVSYSFHAACVPDLPALSRKWAQMWLRRVWRLVAVHAVCYHAGELNLNDVRSIKGYVNHN